MKRQLLSVLVGAALARAGHPVTFIVRDPAHPIRARVESEKLGDFEVAVEEVATFVRIGSALFK